MVGTRIETHLLKCVREFYETAVAKCLSKFLFSDPTIKELAFLGPCICDKSSFTGLVGLTTRFKSFTAD